MQNRINTAKITSLVRSENAVFEMLVIIYESMIQQNTLCIELSEEDLEKDRSNFMGYETSYVKGYKEGIRFDIKRRKHLNKLYQAQIDKAEKFILENPELSTFKL